MKYSILAVLSAITTTAFAEEGDGIIRMSMIKRSDHEFVNYHLERERDALQLALEAKNNPADLSKGFFNFVLYPGWRLAICQFSFLVDNLFH